MKNNVEKEYAKLGRVFLEEHKKLSNVLSHIRQKIIELNYKSDTLNSFEKRFLNKESFNIQNHPINLYLEQKEELQKDYKEILGKQKKIWNCFNQLPLNFFEKQIGLDYYFQENMNYYKMVSKYHISKSNIYNIIFQINIKCGRYLEEFPECFSKDI